MNDRMIRLQVNIFIMVFILSPTYYTDSTTHIRQLRLPEEHIPYFLNNNLDVKAKCQAETDCPYQKYFDVNKCWGYEPECPEKLRMSTPTCPGEAKGWVKTKEEQVDSFWKQADFGYIFERKSELESICEPTKPGDSSLKCVDHARYCIGKNIYMDFNEFDLTIHNNDQWTYPRFREDMFKNGQVGGRCQMNKAKLEQLGEHKSPLQSWYAEIQNFDDLKFHPINDKKCSVIIDKPTILMKLDAGVNMYHHFCDYVNLYVTLHMNNSFSPDVNIIMWDTSAYKYGDFFHDTWKAFSDHDVIHLKDYAKKKVCFKDVVFSFLPRMRRGLFYNMPLIPGCESSSLIRAFSQHVLHRLNITQEGPLKDKIRVTLLERGTKFRNILNQNELVDALKKVDDYEVKVVKYNHQMPFLEQLQSTYNSDILIGMHGAGLTHLLFQPDWGVIFEVYNCDDVHCYHDLAKLRGLRYLTWENQDKLIQEDEGHHPQLGAHKKFTNYEFDPDEFLRMVAKGAEHVRNHPAFIQARRDKYGPVDDVDNSGQVKNEL